MNISMKYIAYQFCFLFSLLLPFSLNADTLTLKDGSTIKGKITNIGVKEVVINTVIGEISIEGEKILNVEWSDKDTLPKDSSSLLTPAPQQETLTSQYPDLTYAEMHLKKPVGMGAGLIFDTRKKDRGTEIFANGGNVFYAINLNESSQLNTQLDISTREPNQPVFNVPEPGEQVGDNIYIASSILTAKLFSTYRVFPISNSGLYIGAGGGLLVSTFKLKTISTYDTTLQKYTSAPYPYSSQLSGLFVMGEIGWQGKDGYYFHIGFQPAFMVWASDDYDVNNIENAVNFKNEINNVHEKQKSLNKVTIGFSVFF